MPRAENMMPGSIVTIYRDPITCKEVEGKAVLLAPAGFSPDYVSDTQRVECWWVRFLGERTAYQRGILTTMTFNVEEESA